MKRQARTNSDIKLGFKIKGEHGCAAGICSNPEQPCNDCRRRSESYLVRDKVWNKAGMTVLGFLCVRCLEKRLGRQLRKADYLTTPVRLKP